MAYYVGIPSVSSTPESTMKGAMATVRHFKHSAGINTIELRKDAEGEVEITVGTWERNQGTGKWKRTL